MKFKIKHFIISLSWLSVFSSCKKLVDIDPPVSSIVTEQAFGDSSNASAAISGIYGNMMNVGFTFMNGALTIDLGKSSDELIPFFSGDDKLYSNTLTVTDPSTTPNDIWIPAYQFIYQANACIEGVQASTGLNEQTKKQFTGEAKFLRALCYFYMINIYNDVPFVVTTDFKGNAVAGKTPKQEIMQQLAKDLEEVQTLLPRDYTISANERTRANYWAATALLARLYLYMGDWVNAEKEASELISETSLFSLDVDPKNVFLSSTDNTEPILQWSFNTQNGNATPEALQLIPNDPPNNIPNLYLSDQLLHSFEDGDLRKSSWVDSTLFGDPPDALAYYFPFKYKIGLTSSVPGGPANEFVTVLRLAEQYLIRAEARAQQSNLGGAIEDINVIRQRAQLMPLSNSLDQPATFAAIMQERRVELFAEWGHRWLDLKRTGQIDAVMSVATPIKGQGTEWASFQQLYPVPAIEIKYDPNLTQNPGY